MAPIRTCLHRGPAAGHCFVSALGVRGRVPRDHRRLRQRRDARLPRDAGHRRVLPVIFGVVLFTRPGLGIAALALLFSLFARGHAHHLADAAADRLARLAEARRLSMTRLDVNVARCEALFASGLQRSDAPSAAVVAADFTGVESTNTPGTHRVTAVAPRYSRRRRAACSMTSSVSRYSDRICWCRSETGLLLEHSDVPWQWCRIRCLVGSVASRAKGWKVWVCCSSAGRPNARR